MFISSISIKNYRLFPSGGFGLGDINLPNNTDEGSGLTVFVGENGCGKTSLLEAISLPLLPYKAEAFTINDLNNPAQKTEIEILASSNFTVLKTVPRGDFQAKGFRFKGGKRTRDSQTYLSPVIVSDQEFIPADGETNVRTDGPDVRVSVNNPFIGPRFKENDILYLGESRIYQTRFGTAKKTRFDHLMEDFDFQYLQGVGPQDLSFTVKSGIGVEIQNTFLKKAIDKFKEISNAPITLEILNNYHPFRYAFFAEKRNNNLQVSLNRIGSGYEMIFSILYSFYLAEQSGKQLIVLIDEPELHLHPKLQQKFVKVLLEISKTAQIILSTQSPLFIKDINYNQNVKINILKRYKKDVVVSPIEDQALPLPSANEVNYIAFELSTPEYHNELYGHLQEKEGKYTEDVMEKYLEDKGIPRNKSYIKSFRGTPSAPYDVTLCTYIRNLIHHPENTSNAQYSENELRQSIELLRKCLL
ncbi:MAG: AAA family ATPase [Candidatus Pacebacteria bacterium]|nr:AAA family ATPase [Candidatus Paceibacterota bacterium]